jgi:carotenoid cleavage dioxygenase
VGPLAKPGAGPRHKNVANTDVVHHAGRLLALWWEGGEPHELSLPDLATKGTFTYGDTLPGGLTSHAKLDPATGELFFISWGRKAPWLHVGVAGPQGRVTRHSPVELPGPRIQHDMALSERFICVFDFPMRIDLGRPDQLGFLFEPETPARIGLVERHDASAPVRWFEAAPGFMWHVSSAWDDGCEFVLTGARIAHPTRRDAAGRAFDHGPMVDGEHRFDARAYEWRLNVETGAVSERPLDDLPIEFPRVNDARICSGARYSYMVELADAPTVKGRGLVKYDLATGGRERLAFPPGWSGNEFSFAPRDGASGEDDGYLLGFVTSEAELRSELWIVPARALADGPLARVQLPQRIVPKFHGRWIGAEKLG